MIIVETYLMWHKTHALKCQVFMFVNGSKHDTDLEVRSK